MGRCGFYVVADAAFYVGAVATLNSLRLAGHDEPAFVLDAGLTEAQRDVLARTAQIVPLADDVPPRLAKWAAPLAEPSEVTVILDADLLVVRSLSPLLELAASGAVVAFADDHPERFDPRWPGALGVASLRRRTYVNVGFVALPPIFGPQVLERLRQLQTGLALGGHTRIHANSADLFAYPDQDSWNAVLSAVVADDGLQVFPHELAPFQREDPAVVNRETLECRTKMGARPYLLHHIGAKPWLERTVPSAYSDLLPRVLFGEDVLLRLDPPEVPLRLRPGGRGAAERLRLEAQRQVYRRLLRPLASKREALPPRARAALPASRGRR